MSEITLCELEELDRAASAIGETKTDELKQKPTIKQAVLRVLRDHDGPMTSQQILDEINARFFGGSIERTSLSLQLSRLKNHDLKISLEGEHWRLLKDEGSAYEAEPSFLD